MSLSNAEYPPGAPRGWSMTRWLTLYYMLSVFVLLAAASAFLYWELARGVEHDNRDLLIHKIDVLTLLAREQPFDRAGIEQEVFEEAEISAQSRSPFYLRMLDSQGRLVTETPGMATLLPATVFPSVEPAQTREAHWRSGPSNYLLASSRTAVAPGAQSWCIQAAVDISTSESLLFGYRRNIGIVLLGGVLIAAPIGAWLVRRGLKPIDAITRDTERITAQQLHLRINAGHWPGELIGLAKSFDDMLDRLEEAFERLKRFSADLAHELRTPINNLMGEAQVTLSRARSETEYVHVLESALEEHARLARMIDSMLFLAQAEQARTALEPAPLDARAELQAVADFYQALADEQGVELVCAGEGTVLADPLLLRRAVSNLLSNALKHTPRHGRVVLSVAVEDAQSVVRIADTGAGIAAEHLPRLGDRFYRADPARANSAAGAGLGLAIVKSIMALHGGKLSIDSEMGQGTTASLLFQRVDS